MPSKAKRENALGRDSFAGSTMKEEFVYEGWMGQEAQKFFEGNCIREERDGCDTVGSSQMDIITWSRSDAEKSS